MFVACSFCLAERFPESNTCPIVTKKSYQNKIIHPSFSSLRFGKFVLSDPNQNIHMYQDQNQRTLLG